MLGIYNRFQKFGCVAKTEEKKAVLKNSEQVTTEEVTEEDSDESYSH